MSESSTGLSRSGSWPFVASIQQELFVDILFEGLVNLTDFQGSRVWLAFQGKHPKSKRISKDGVEWCTDVFDK